MEFDLHQITTAVLIAIIVELARRLLNAASVLDKVADRVLDKGDGKEPLLVRSFPTYHEVSKAVRESEDKMEKRAIDLYKTAGEKFVLQAVLTERRKAIDARIERAEARIVRLEKKAGNGA